MALFTTLSALGAGTTQSIPTGMANWQGQGGGGLSVLINFSGAGVGIGQNAASATVTVQVSNDPAANPNNTAAQQALARWNNHDTLKNMTTDQNSSIVFPILYVRMYATAYGSGTVTMGIGWADASQPK